MNLRSMQCLRALGNIPRLRVENMIDILRDKSLPLKP